MEISYIFLRNFLLTVFNFGNRLCFQYMSLRQKALNSDIVNPVIGTDSKQTPQSVTEKKRKLCNQTTESQTDIDYLECEMDEKSKVVSELKSEAKSVIKYKSHNNETQCTDHDEIEGPDFSEKVKQIFNDLIKNDKDTYAKHFLSYICARLYKRTGEVYNPSASNIIKAGEYGHRYHNFITSEIGATENTYKKMVGSGDPSAWRQALKKNLTNPMFAKYLETLPMMTKFFAEIEKRKKRVIDVDAEDKETLEKKKDNGSD